MTLTAGTTLGPYKIVSPLGAGGMGEVYRAKDTRLDRQVAVKVLPDQFARDQTALKRFQREAKAIAALSHPNVLAVFDVGREKETSYVVTELLEGQTLRQRIRETSLPWRKAVEVGCAIADGLAAAHDKGITHRDLKPENIFLTNDGVVKILDFGLARMDSPTGEKPKQDAAHTPTVTLDTRPGTIIGTLNYMSPEQLRGKPTDTRTDIFSFGCVLYEMITGERAFKGETSADTMTAILRETPPSIRASREDVGPELERVIDRCLEKKPEHRFHSTSDLAFTLRSVLADSGSQKTATATATDRSKWTFGVPLVVVAVFLASVGGYLGFRALSNSAQQPSAVQVIPIASLAILPFENISNNPDTDYLSSEIPASIIDKMSGLKGLSVISRSGAFRFDPAREDASSFGKRLGASVVLTGQLNARGQSLTIRAELVDVATNQQLWSKRYPRELTDILAIEADITQSISDALRIQLTQEEQSKLEKRFTTNAEAHRALLEGRFWFQKFTTLGWRKALGHFKDAVRLDPAYALAYAELSKAYSGLGIWFGDMPPAEAAPQAKKAAVKAIALDDTLGEAHGALAFNRLFFDWDWSGAEKEFLLAIRLAPESGRLRLHYSILLRLMGRLREAEETTKMALLLDPTFPMNSVDLAMVYANMGRYTEGIVQCQKALELDPQFPPAHLALGYVYLAKGDYDEAISNFQRNSSLRNRQAGDLGFLGSAYGLAGQKAKARAILAELAAVSSRGRGQFAAAMIHAGLGNVDAAFASLEQAYRQRDPALIWLNVEFVFSPLRSDPRYVSLARRMKLDPAPMRRMKTRTSDDKIRIAVIPFDDTSPRPNEWFASGMTEAVIDDLSTISGLHVISYTSVKQYKATTESTPTIAAALNVDYIVSGSVFRDEDKVSIRARLHDAQEERVWSDQYQRNMSDIIALQQDIAKAIADGVEVTLTPREATHLASASVVIPEAYQAYMHGMSFVRRATKPGCYSALKLFDEALEKDPNFALAHVGRAKAFMTLANDFVPPKEAMPKAREAARRALELDANLAEAYAIIGKVRLEYEWDWDGAYQAFEKALTANPSSADAHIGKALYLSAMNRGEEALAELDMVQELDLASIYTNFDHGVVSYMARDYDRTIRDAKAALDIDPQWWAAHLWMGLAYSIQGKHDDAVRHAHRVVELHDGPTWAAMAGGVYAVAGHREEALKIYNDLKEQETHEYICPYELATIPLGLGDIDTTFMEMNRACEARSNCLAWLQRDPRLDDIRDDPRFDDLLERVGFQPQNRLRVAAAPRFNKKMIAVLPFIDLSQIPQEWFTDGMTDEVITHLGRINPKKLGIIARTSVMRYKNTVKTIEEIGRELGVEYLLEGSVHRSGNSIRINAQLIQVSDQTQLWSDSFTRDLSDVFAIPTEVATAVARSLAMELLPHWQATQAKSPTASPAAYDAYLKGRYHWNRRTGDSLRKSLSFFREAIRLDPVFATAHAGMAHAYVVLGGHHFVQPIEAATKARAAALRALELDETLGEAYTVLAVVDTSYSWNWPGGLKNFERAIELNPNHATAHQWYAETLVGLARYEEGQREIQVAKRLDPLSPIITASVGWFHYFAGEYDEAIRSLRNVIDFDDTFAFAHYALGEVYLEQGKFDEGVTTLERAVHLASHGEFRANLGRAYALAGQAERAKQLLDELQGESGRSYQSPYLLARIYVAMGRFDEAFEHLSRACDSHDWGLRHLKGDPAFKGLYGDCRFADLLKRTRLSP